MSETTHSGLAAPQLRARPAALGFIYAAIMMNTISMGVIAPVFPTLVKRLTGQGDAGAAQVMGVFAAVWALMNLVWGPIFGNLSDRYGRRPVLLVAMFGLAFDYVVMAVAPNIGWLFVGRVIAGITASSGPAAGAYVADVSTPESRARNFGRFQAAANAGILLGPALGGYAPLLFQHTGLDLTRIPFWIAAVLALANGLYGLFVIPESLGHDRRMPFHWGRANPVGAIKLLTSRPGLMGMASIMFLVWFGGSSFNSVFQFYTHYRFNFGPPQFATLLMVLSAGGIVVQSFLAGWAARILGERGAVIVGMSLNVAAFAALALAPNVTLFWAFMIVPILAGIAFPNLMSLLSHRVGVDQQGQLQGGLNVLFGLSMLIGPLTFTNIFALAVSPRLHLDLPGLPMLVGGVLTAGAVFLSVVYARPVEEPLAAEPA